MEAKSIRTGYKFGDREVKSAADVKGTGLFKEALRRAKPGEYVMIVQPLKADGTTLENASYKQGEIYQIISKTMDGYLPIIKVNGDVTPLFDEEYVVLEGYNPEKKVVHKETYSLPENVLRFKRKAKAGDYVELLKGTNGIPKGTVLEIKKIGVAGEPQYGDKIEEFLWDEDYVVLVRPEDRVKELINELFQVYSMIKQKEE